MMIGETLLKRYKIESELGKGGMGVVYKAHDTLLSRAVAIKFLNTSGVGTREKERLLQEARAAAQLNHPNIASVYDVGETEGNPFIVMELVKGNTLRKTEKPTLSEALNMAQQICRALEHAHDNGIIHRDLKLENIVITNTHVLKLMDFGLAHIADDDRLTQEDALVGTLAYLAPELIQGEPASVQSDLYAFGIIFYELLVGKEPFQGNFGAVLDQHLHGQVTPPSKFSNEISEWLDALVLRLLSKRSEERPASAREVLAILEQQSTPPITAAYRFPSKPMNNLPAQLTSFIGREKELEQIKKRLEQNRLVTLMGSGGIGKTRLAIQVASELVDEYSHGVWLVELAPITDPALVTQTVCAALDVTPQGNADPLTVLTDYLKPKKTLLVVDNCEHLIDSSAQLCDTLLRACPNARILTSSREALGIDGEYAYRVPSLSLPNPNDGLQKIEKSEAVKLFMERATAILPEFEMTEANASGIAYICQRLDGIALAIELAASRVKILKVEQIASRLDGAFRLLTGGSRTALPRQQTLRALIDWSYNLLSDEERIVLHRLSVFVGGWTLEAAEFVCDNPNMLDLLAHLVDKSIVAVDFEHGDESRYYLLETIRQYAREKLNDSGEGEALHARHLAYFLKLAEEAEPHLVRREQMEWFRRLEQDYENLRAALEWAVESKQNEPPEAKLRLVSALESFWYMRGHWIESREWMTRVLATTQQSTNTLNWARTLLSAALFEEDFEKQIKLCNESLEIFRKLNDKPGIAKALFLKGYRIRNSLDIPRSKPLLEESLRLYRELQDKRNIALLIFNLAYIVLIEQGPSAARHYYEESLQIGRDLGDRRFTSLPLMWLGFLAMNQGEWSTAKELIEESLSLGRELGDKYRVLENLRQLGWLSLGQGNFQHANELFEESLILARELGSRHSISTAILGMGRVARFKGEHDKLKKLIAEVTAMGENDNIANIHLFTSELARLQSDYVAARSYSIEALTAAKEVDDQDLIAYCLEEFAALDAAERHAKRSVTLFAAAEALREAIQIVLLPVEKIEVDKNIATVRAQLVEATFNAAWAKGRAMKMEDAIEYALNALE